MIGFTGSANASCEKTRSISTSKAGVNLAKFANCYAALGPDDSVSDAQDQAIKALISIGTSQIEVLNSTHSYRDLAGFKQDGEQGINPHAVIRLVVHLIG
jgi:hypothetical protein